MAQVQRILGINGFLGFETYNNSFIRVISCTMSLLDTGCIPKSTTDTRNKRIKEH